jgi:hypothetical protein
MLQRLITSQHQGKKPDESHLKWREDSTRDQAVKKIKHLAELAQHIYTDQRGTKKYGDSKSRPNVTPPTQIGGYLKFQFCLA